MGFFDMFDKIDDIIYKPIETLCNWIEEPLKSFKSKRQIKQMQVAAEIDEKTRRQEAELQAYSARQQVEIQAESRRLNAEIDQMIQEQEMANREKFVEALKRYQTDLARVNVEIVESIGLMTIDLRKSAHALI